MKTSPEAPRNDTSYTHVKYEGGGVDQQGSRRRQTRKELILVIDKSFSNMTNECIVNDAAEYRSVD